ncbi:MAG: sugar ABC transporter ATP-binding protein [Rhodococcus sp. (in: high G+C Gram-positive bacteria)]|nr:MAG: sugar ABC transporter ATP-binding protein [Rhodococcus sp. (in: high G+C Gram-positive bacteria)]
MVTTDERPAEPALAARRVSKAFTGALALDHFDLVVEHGEIHALVGGNGSGKSTFIKVLSGYHQPEAGSEVELAGERLHFGSPHSALALGCRFVHQDLGLVPTSSALDNLFLTTGFPQRWGNLRTKAALRQAREDLARVGLELDPRRLVVELSPAERTGVAIARALQEQNGAPVRMLVLDEPTATLPKSEVDRLLGIVQAVAARGVGVLYVSHRLEEVLTVSHKVTVLRDGRKVTTVDTPELDRQQLVRLLVGSEIDDTRAIANELPQYPSGSAVLEVDQLATPTISDVTLRCRPGEILGVAGISGSGSDSLLGAIFGASPRLGGTVRVGTRTLAPGRPDRASDAGIAYLPPDRIGQSGVMDMGADDNITLAGLSAVWNKIGWRRGAQTREAESWFGRLSVAPRRAYGHPLKEFSGGNQQKVLLAKWLRLNPRVLLLDEPTQGVDIGARAILHAEIVRAAEEGAAVVCQSTDLEELSALCQRVLVLNHGSIASVLEGDQVTVSNISRACLATTSAGAA